MRFLTLTAVAALALAGTAAGDFLSPDAKPSLFVDVETKDAVVGEPVLIVVSMTDGGGLRSLAVDWGDGAAETFGLEGTAQTVTLDHVYEAEGRFEIQATVRDSAGQISSATVAVTVGPAPEPAVSGP